MKAKKFWLFKDFRNILFVFALSFFATAFMSTILRLLGIGTVYMYSKEMDTDFWYGCVYAPIWEDLLFRFVPFAIIIHYSSKRQWDKAKWFWAVISSMVFGAYVHDGYWSMYIQGVTGFCICYLYFKNRFGYFSGVIAHALWNFSLGYILPSLGNFNPHHSYY